MFKICILTAGRGTRQRYAVGSNKALLPIGNGTALSHIVSKVPVDSEIVIAIGYNSDMVMNYATRMWGDRVSYIHADYIGIGRGPGHSLLCCRELLNCPFVFSACDTIVTEDIPAPDMNWMGVADVNTRLPYLTVEVGNGLISKVYDKGDKDATYLASIGLVGVKDYEVFWDGLANPKKLVQGEHQDTSGLNALIPHGLTPRKFSWFDTGSMEGYGYAYRYFSQNLS